MRTSMLPLVDVARGNWFLADKAVDITLTPITGVFDFLRQGFRGGFGACQIGSELLQLNIIIIGCKRAPTHFCRDLVIFPVEAGSLALVIICFRR